LKLSRSRTKQFVILLSFLFLVFAATPAIANIHISQQNSGQTQTEPKIPSELQQYLSLTSEQTLRMQGILRGYEQLVSAKQAEMRTAQVNAAIDPAASASRIIEKDLAAIVEAGSRARHEISTVLTAHQLSKLLDLRATTSDDPERLRVAEQAASLNLIDFKDKSVNRPLGGTTSVFAGDTAIEVEQPNTGKKPLSKRKPPQSPPP
jgi:ABC-type Na+ efflux pump permease subunit